MKKYDKILTKKYLYQEYIELKHSMNIIANKIECSVSCIYNKLLQFHIKIRTVSECQQKELHPFYGKKRPEFSILMKQHNPFKGKHHTQKTKQQIKNKHIGKHFSKKTEFTSNKMKSLWADADFRRKILNSRPIRTGKQAPGYIHGKGYEPYPMKFNFKLKEIIKKRDNYTCQKCSMTEEEHIIVYGKGLHIHHIDYNKNNCREDNLITTCNTCNIIANFNRDYWYAYFTYLMEAT